RRTRAGPAAAQPEAAEARGKVLVLASPALESHVEAVGALEVRPRGPEEVPVGRERGEELGPLSQGSPPVSDRNQDTGPPGLAMRAEELAWTGAQPPGRRPAPDEHSVVDRPPREALAEMQPLPRKKPARKRAAPHGLEEAPP